MRSIVLSGLLLLSCAIQAQSEFNMHETHSIKDPAIQVLVAATAAMVLKHDLKKTEAGYLPRYQTLKEVGYCSDFSLASQKTPSHCSGTLISDRHTLTAGHCADQKNMCQDFQWIFDYAQDSSGNAPAFFDGNAVYGCTKIVKSIHVNFNLGLTTRLYKTFFRTDFAIIELDRPVRNRIPVTLSAEPLATAETKVFSISYPLGMPAKVSTGGEVQSDMNSESDFWTLLILFSGSSGGPIFNQNNELIGVISKGMPSTAKNDLKNCYFERDPGLLNGENPTALSNSNAQMKKILQIIKKKKIPATINRMDF